MSSVKIIVDTNVVSYIMKGGSRAEAYATQGNLATESDVDF